MKLMVLDGEKLIQLALEANASGAAILETSTIQFYEDVRKACEKNLCRKYDTNWMGPPAIGPVNELSKRVHAYRQGLLFQTIHRFNSRIEYAKGMFAAAGIHEKVFRRLLTKIRDAYPSEEILPLNAGAAASAKNALTSTGSRAAIPIGPSRLLRLMASTSWHCKKAPGSPITMKRTR